MIFSWWHHTDDIVILSHDHAPPPVEDTDAGDLLWPLGPRLQRLHSSAGDSPLGCPLPPAVAVVACGEGNLSMTKWNASGKAQKTSFKAQYVCLFSPSHLSFLDLKRWNHQCLISVLLCKYSHLKGPTGFVWRQWLTQTRSSSAASCWQCPSAASPSASWGPRAAAPGSWTSCQCQLLWIC